ncbi:type I restriction enzyme, S subunit [Treponema berlinense]|uniref:Type I restriction enzyme, S subunit n=1 Tax=Treponema berlinense TaxID=225004 RepID=A0A1T4KMX2_9SPIR|nr:restriction endonuclease subunit S [Treponema berlinense]SJZ43723.1 type I restriction enzyme, S subunit [Treponema berlinense]
MTAKDLKNALLQEAVQGKLVPQIASEGNARDLLEEIRKEKLSHGFANSYGICDGKDKKTKKSDLRSKSQISVTKKELPEITEDEIPFEIPENWCWCRLGEIVSILGDGIHGTPNYDISGNYYFVNGNNLNNGKIEIKPDTKKVNQSEYEKYKKELNNNTVFVSINGTLGNIAFYESEKIILGKSACYFNLIKNEMKIYIYWLIKTKYFLDYANEEATGTTIKNVSLAAMRNFPIPLPPLAEQKRIVAAIEKFMPLIEEYGKKETQLKAINEKIGTLTKKAILQEAVQGKLVPQIAAEGNARDLLKEIRKKKLSHGLDFANAKSGKKKSKKETALAGSNPCDIKEDEIPFDIPENWCWCRLGKIVYNNGQKTPDKEFSYIDIGSIDNLHQKLNDKENFVSPEQAPSRARKIVKRGDIIYATVRPYLHNMCIIDKDFEKEPIASTGFAVLACYPQINNQYLFYYLLSPSFDNYANDTENSKGVAYPAINDDKLYKGVIPLPPLAEQKRIVVAIEKMLPLCEKLGE